MSNPYRDVIDEFLHPRCITRRTTGQIIALLLLGMAIAVIAMLLVQRWWVIPITGFIGLTLIVHPVCLISNHRQGHTYKHSHQDLWP